MEHDLLHLIKACKTFASLSEHDCKALLAKFNRIHLKENEILFRQGDISNQLYLLVSGKLSAALLTATKEEKVVGIIHPGETVGELGAISNEPRSLTIKASEDSILLELSSDEFQKLCQQHPDMIFEAINPLINRSRDIIQRLAAEETRKNVVIIAADKNNSLESFFNDFQAHISNKSDILLLSDYHPEDYKKYDTAAELQHFIKMSEKHHKLILYLLQSSDTLLAETSFKNADAIYIIAYGNSSPSIDPALLEKITPVQVAHKTIKLELILLHHGNDYLSCPTSEWLKKLILRCIIIFAFINTKIMKDYCVSYVEKLSESS